MKQAPTPGARGRPSLSRRVVTRRMESRNEAGADSGGSGQTELESESRNEANGE